MNEEQKPQYDDPIVRKKERQRDAWERWYKSPKGEAYRAKRRKRPEPAK